MRENPDDAQIGIAAGRPAVIFYRYAWIYLVSAVLVTGVVIFAYGDRGPVVLTASIVAGLLACGAMVLLLNWRTRKLLRKHWMTEWPDANGAGYTELPVDVDNFLDKAMSQRRSRMETVLEIDRTTVAEDWKKLGRRRYLLAYRSLTRPWSKQYLIAIHRKYLTNNLNTHFFLVNGRKCEFSDSALGSGKWAGGLTMGEWNCVTNLIAFIRRDVRPTIVGSERWQCFWPLIDELKSTCPKGYFGDTSSWYDTGAGFRIEKSDHRSNKGAIADICLSDDGDDLTVNGASVLDDWFTKDTGELAALLWKTIRAIPDRPMADIKTDPAQMDARRLVPGD